MGQAGKEYAIVYKDWVIKVFDDAEQAETAIKQYSRWFIGLKIKPVVKGESV